MRERTLWTWHLIAGLVVFGLLGAHMTIMHLDNFIGFGNPAGGSAVSWENVIGRAQAMGTTSAYILLLGFALFHGLYGLRNILLELGPSPRKARLLSRLLAVVGIALFVLGTWAAMETARIATGGLT